MDKKKDDVQIREILNTIRTKLRAINKPSDIAEAIQKIHELIGQHNIPVELQIELQQLQSNAAISASQGIVYQESKNQNPVGDFLQELDEFKEIYNIEKRIDELRPIVHEKLQCKMEQLKKESDLLDALLENPDRLHEEFNSKKFREYEQEILSSKSKAPNLNLEDGLNELKTLVELSNKYRSNNNKQIQEKLNNLSDDLKPETEKNIKDYNPQKNPSNNAYIQNKKSANELVTPTNTLQEQRKINNKILEENNKDLAKIDAYHNEMKESLGKILKLTNNISVYKEKLEKKEITVDQYNFVEKKIQKITLNHYKNNHDYYKDVNCPLKETIKKVGKEAGIETQIKSFDCQKNLSSKDSKKPTHIPYNKKQGKVRSI